MEVKICGIRTLEEAKKISELNPDYIGFVLFFPKSKRNISIEEASCILKGIPSYIKKVAVTVSPSLEQIKMIENAHFDLLQIHGDFDASLIDYINIPVIRAFNAGNINDLSFYINNDKTLGILFDAPNPGSGQTFDYSLIPDIKDNDKKIFLSGGLNPKNVRSAIQAVNPQVVDVSSGVEKKDGTGKDLNLVEEFIKAARS
ncbi:MAG: phosphoribosylanthranilate isomerase [Lachnospiraceae bacterium]|nr:phosphoribosylanthranilate isomerase [Lachnospiraceae bacterium]